MAFDGLVLFAIKDELEKLLVGGRVEKVYQPAREELVVLIRRAGRTHRLLISAAADHPRVHLTEETRENPATPPAFCMIVRKYLTGGRVVSLEQPDLERVLRITVDTVTELGEQTQKVLVAEIMGKHSNIILLDPARGVILDGIKRYTHAVSRYREVIPGRPYLPPPAQGKVNPLTLNDVDMLRQAIYRPPFEAVLADRLFQSLAGFSPEMGREIMFRTGLPQGIRMEECGDYELSLLWSVLSTLVRTAADGSFGPCVVWDAGRPVSFSMTPLTQYASLTLEAVQSVNQAVDLFYQAQRGNAAFTRQQGALTRIVRAAQEHCQRKTSSLEEELADAREKMRFRLLGELLTANLHAIKPGSSEALLMNFYEPDAPVISIELDPSLTPAENAQAYFRRYNKARVRLETTGGYLKQTQEEAFYLEGLLNSIEQAQQIEDLQDIKEELASQGYAKKEPGSGRGKSGLGRTKAARESSPRRYASGSGFEILVGRNNRQNDYLTTKLARDHDLWLHAKDTPGSHVIVRTEGRPVPPETLEKAAILAAYFSRARNSTSVPVDYTDRKNVWKPKGGRPGMVLYEKQKTVFINPDAGKVAGITIQEP